MWPPQKPFPPVYEKGGTDPSIIRYIPHGILVNLEDPVWPPVGSIPSSSVNAGQIGCGFTFFSTSVLQTWRSNLSNQSSRQKVILDFCLITVLDVDCFPKLASQLGPDIFQTMYTQE